MIKLRKMLGDVHSSPCQELMKLMDTQSHQTLSLWAITYAKERYFPLYPKKESSLYQTLEKCESYLKQECSLQECKPFLKEARADAKDITDPIVEAASKAIATACATIQTPTNALGFLFYGSAAMAYHQAGLFQTKEIYDQLAIQELQNALHSLQQYAKDEPHPVRMKWSCK